jgi:O-antigen/teichoic acid export membrane protein
MKYKIISDRISLLKKSAYSKNILSVFTGAAISQLIPLITAPILTRIYTPQDYGILGVLMSICALITVFSTFGYVNAIIIADNDKEADKTVGLCLRNLLWVSLLSFLIITIGYTLLINFYKIIGYGYILWIVPLVVFFSGFSAIISFLATRYQHFKMLSVNRVISAILSAVISITVGLIFKSVIGLILGFVISQFFSSIVLYFLLKRQRSIPTLMEYIQFDIKLVKKKFINFPKFVMVSDFINTFSNQIPIFALSSYAPMPQDAVGFYNMSNRILGLPITLISATIGDVFKQRAAADYNELGSCRPIFMKTFKALLVASIIPFAILIFFGADIFAFAFGEKWREAGHYSQILGVMFFFRFTVSPLTYVFYIANKQKLDFFLHLLFIVIGFISLYIGLKKFENINTSLWIFSISYSIIYLVYLYFSYSYCKK